MDEITYTRQGDYNLPNLLPPQQEPEAPSGKYALLRRKFLKEHRRITYTNLLTSGQALQPSGGDRADAPSAGWSRW